MLGVVLNVAVVAHAALLAEGVLTSYEKGDWLKIDTFQTVCMFDESGNSKPEGRQTLTDALGRKEQVSHLSLDAEGKGHCSCHHVCVYALGDDCPTRGKVDTFVQLGIWFKDGSCSVFLDYYPNQWLEEVATALPGVVVTTWGEERIARSVFGTCALDLQAELTGRICDDLKLPIPRDGKLGLKRAYGWVAHRAGRTVYDYSSGLEVCHQPEYVWQRRYPSYLSDRHTRYAAVDAFATAAIYGTYKQDRRMIINLPSDECEGIVEKLDCTSLAALICGSKELHERLATMVQPYFEEERERRKAKKALEELREFLISEAEIEKRFVDGKNLLLLDAEGVKCMDSLARFARLKRFDECCIPDFSKDRIRHALNRRFGVPQPAELRYLSTFRT